jgi:hypothetical protein
MARGATAGADRQVMRRPLNAESDKEPSSTCPRIFSWVLPGGGVFPGVLQSFFWCSGMICEKSFPFLYT